jgi:hypothetical protein
MIITNYIVPLINILHIWMTNLPKGYLVDWAVLGNNLDFKVLPDPKSFQIDRYRFFDWEKYHSNPMKLIMM